LISSDLGDFLYCLGSIPYFIGSARLRLYNILDRRGFLNNIDMIYDFSNIIIKTSEKEEFLTGYLYIYNKEGLHEISGAEVGIYKPIYVDKPIFIVRVNDFGKMLKKINDKFIRNKSKDLLRNTVKCWGRRHKTCIVSNNEKLKYMIGYLSLATKCHLNSIKINTISLAEDMLKAIYYPVIELLEKQRIRINHEIIDIINNTIITYYAELISKYRLALPKEFDISELLSIYSRKYI
jgi:hypothetical protein